MTGGGGGLGGAFPLLQSLTAAEIARALAPTEGEPPRPPIPPVAGDPATPPQNTTAQRPQTTVAQGAGPLFAPAPVAEAGDLRGADPFGTAGLGTSALPAGSGAMGRETPWSSWLSGMAAPLPAMAKGLAGLADGPLQQAAQRGSGALEAGPIGTTGGTVATPDAKAPVLPQGQGAMGSRAEVAGANTPAPVDHAARDQGLLADPQGARQSAAGAGHAPRPLGTGAALPAGLLFAAETASGTDGLPTGAGQAGLKPAVVQAQATALAAQMPLGDGGLGGSGTGAGGIGGGAAISPPNDPRATVTPPAFAASHADGTAPAAAPSPAPAQETRSPDRASQPDIAASTARGASLPDLPAAATLRAALSVALAEVAGLGGFPLTADTKAGSAASMVIFNAAMIPQWPPAFKAQGAMADAAALQVAGAQLAQMSPEEAAEYLAKMAGAFGFLLVVKKRLSKTLKEEKETLLGMFSFLGVALDALVKGLQTALDLTVEQQAMLEEVLAEGKGRGQKRRQQLRL